ncbi:hypothetical protein AUCHE_08_05570 [Austwickia chelonae NBRC 105200]|uniref:FAD-binding FR-type domain-containing protein n=1 Tax=Austwickia chelonae NBRC 105200 TaxID=1184607 RepID=K6VSJ0_9MICO|nr:hypothetical protein AUCHE_08_05570 [Austwickia chelonae NBRC 105200]
MATVWMSLLFVLWLWWANGGVSRATSTAEGWTSMGRLTGLLSSDLLLLQVLMMARIPFVEKAFGQDALTGTHRLAGFGSFVLMLAHLGMTLFGYAGASWTQLWTTTLDVTLDMPAMLLAVLGTLALCAVVLSSVRSARRRLRYETWHLIHLYAYLGCFLALPHQLWTGADFLSSPIATVYWWTLWTGAAASVLLFRVGLPIRRNLRHRLVVTDVRAEGRDVTTVTVTGRHLDRLPVIGGQFFLWRFLDGPGWTRAHPYSLSAAPDGRSLRISVAGVGDGSRRLATMQPGTRVLIEGPYGRLHEGVRTRRPVLLMASGIGIAPMLSLLESLSVQPGEATVIYRVREPASAALLPRVQAVTDELGAHLYILDGPRISARRSWLPESWCHLSDAEALTCLVPQVAGHDVFVCGATAWMDAVEAAAIRAGVPSSCVHTERFTD